jgi:hypothetical protein
VEAVVAFLLHVSWAVGGSCQGSYTQSAVCVQVCALVCKVVAAIAFFLARVLSFSTDQRQAEGAVMARLALVHTFSGSCHSMSRLSWSCCGCATLLVHSLCRTGAKWRLYLCLLHRKRTGF